MSKFKKQALDEPDVDVEPANVDVDIDDADGDDDDADGDADDIDGEVSEQQHVDKSGGNDSVCDDNVDGEGKGIGKKAPAIKSLWRGAKGKGNLKGVSDARRFGVIRKFNLLQEQDRRRRTSIFPRRAASLGKGNLKGTDGDKRQALDDNVNDDEDEEVVPWAERQRRRGKTTRLSTSASRRGLGASGGNANLKSEGKAVHPMALAADPEKLRIFRLPAKARPPDPPSLRLPGKGNKSVTELVIIDDDDDDDNVDELVHVIDKLVDDIDKADKVLDFDVDLVKGKGNIGNGGKTLRAPQTEFANAEAFAKAAVQRRD